MALGTIQSGRTEYIRENHSVQVLAGAVDTVIGNFTVPAKCRCRLKSFGNYCDTVAAWGTIYWTIYVNGVPWEIGGGTPRIMDQIGYAAQRQGITEREISGGSLVQITGSNPTAGNVNMGISIEFEAIYQE